MSNTSAEFKEKASSPIVFSLSAEDDDGQSADSSSTRPSATHSLTNSPGREPRERMISVSLDDMYDFSGFPAENRNDVPPPMPHPDANQEPSAHLRAAIAAASSPMKAAAASQKLRVKFLEDALTEVRRELEERQAQLGRAAAWRQRAQLKMRRMDASLQLKRKEVNDLYAENVRLEASLREGGTMTITQQPQEAPTDGECQCKGMSERLAESHQQVQRLTTSTSQLVQALRRSSEKQQKFQAELAAYESRADAAEETAAEAEAKCAAMQEDAKRRSSALEQEVRDLRMQLTSLQDQLGSREKGDLSPDLSPRCAEERALEQPQEAPSEIRGRSLSPERLADGVADEKLLESHKQVQRLTTTMGQLVEALKNANRKEDDLKAQLVASQGKLSEAESKADLQRQELKRDTEKQTEDSVQKAHALKLELEACRKELAMQSERAFKAQARLVQVEARFNLPKAMVVDKPSYQRRYTTATATDAHVPFQV
jgi:chromosome segregation ATPase